jgi:hypothetical protein
MCAIYLCTLRPYELLFGASELFPLHNLRPMTFTQGIMVIDDYSVVSQNLCGEGGFVWRECQFRYFSSHKYNCDRNNYHLYFLVKTSQKWLRSSKINWYPGRVAKIPLDTLCLATIGWKRMPKGILTTRPGYRFIVFKLTT